MPKHTEVIEMTRIVGTQWSPPGSDAAVCQGCTCSVLDNDYGQGYMGIPGSWEVDDDCLLHQEYYSEEYDEE